MIAWRSYGNHEGWVVPGSHPMLLPTSNAEKHLYCVAASEGYYDSCQSYDGAIVSCGLVQVIEKNLFGVSKLLKRVDEDAYGKEWIESCFADFCKLSNSKFENGSWWTDDLKVINEQQQRALFLGCSGRIGSWTQAAKERNKLFLISLSNVFSDSLSRSIQREFMLEVLEQYMWSNGKKLFTNAPNTPIANAAKSLYLNLSINAPVLADKLLLAAINKPIWSVEWLQALANHMCANGLPLWRSRIVALKPALKAAWGISL